MRYCIFFVLCHLGICFIKPLSYKKSVNSCAISGKPVIIITGASASGKSTVTEILLVDYSINLSRALNYTSRPQGKEEIEGQEYHFVTNEAFESMIKQDAFLLWREYRGMYYGASLEALVHAAQSGSIPLIQMNADAAIEMKQILIDAGILVLDVFLTPVPPEVLKGPDGMKLAIEELRQRLVERKRGESNLEIESRLNFAVTLLKMADLFTYQIGNPRRSNATEVATAIAVFIRQHSTF